MSYTEYLRRKTAAAPVVVNTRSKLDASSYTNRVRLSAAGAVFPARVTSSTTVTTIGNNVPVVSGPFGTAIQWSALASSADGTKLAGAGNSSRVWTSTDGGVTWIHNLTSTFQLWTSMTSSADGTKLAATISGGRIYTSTDSAITWVLQVSAPIGNWSSITSSADGTKLAACINGGATGGIYTSTNSGVTWNGPYGINTTWYSIASSADGTKLAAVVFNGQIYTSTNSGVTWNGPYGISANWYSIASSADGTKLAAVVNGGQIYTSTNSGVTWGGPYGINTAWSSITSSADGTKLAASIIGTEIYLSSDSGLTWSSYGGPPYKFWSVIVSSSDGSKVIAAENGGGAGGQIYTIATASTTTTTTVYNTIPKKTARVPDASSFTAYSGGQAIGKEIQSGMPADRVLLNSNSPGSLSGCAVVAEPIPYTPAGTLLEYATSKFSSITFSSPLVTYNITSYTVKTSVPSTGLVVGSNVTISGTSNFPLNNGTFAIVSSTPTSFTVSNASGSADATPLSTQIATIPIYSSGLTSPNMVARTGSQSTRDSLSCHQLQGEKHIQNELGPSLFVDNTIVGIKNYNLPQNNAKTYIASKCIQCGTNGTERGKTCSFCIGANHLHPVDMPHNTRWGPRPRKSAQPIIVAASPSDAHKVGAALRKIPFVGKHHGNDQVGHIIYPKTPYKIPAGTQAMLKINDPQHYPVS